MTRRSIILASLCFLGWFQRSAAGTVSLAINASGTVAGYYAVGVDAPHGFVRTADGTITTFEPPGLVSFLLDDADGTAKMAINSSGTVTGYYRDQDGLRGFVRSADGSIEAFDVPGSDATYPVDINPAGTIAGISVDEGFRDGFVRSPEGTITTFDVEGQPPFVFAINPDGTTAGYYELQGRHGFLRTADGDTTSFDPPGLGSHFEFSLALGEGIAINPAGSVTGSYVEVTAGLPPRNRGYVRDADGTMTSFDAPGVITVPTAINPAGTITGWFEERGTELARRRGFLRAHNGAIIPFEVPNDGNATYPIAISPAGVVTGYTLAGQGFVRERNGTIITFDVPTEE